MRVELYISLENSVELERLKEKQESQIESLQVSHAAGSRA